MKTQAHLAKSPVRSLLNRIAILLVAQLTILVMSATAHAYSRLIVVTPELSPAFQELAFATGEIFSERRDDETETRIMTIEEIRVESEPLNDEFTLVVALGSDALRAILETSRPRHLYAALVPYSEAIEFLANSPPAVGLNIIAAEQPDDRITELTKIAVPTSKRIGVLYGFTGDARMNMLLDAFDHTDLTLVPLRIEPGSHVAQELERRSKDIDALLAIPDPAAVNSSSARDVLRTSHRHAIPIIGYSRAFVDAGALAAVYSSGVQIGKQLGELLAEQALSAAPDKRLMWPRYFSVSVNSRVARTLGMTIEPAAEIQRELDESGMPK